jgi:mannose-1-phosphate guanylyltransferase
MKAIILAAGQGTRVRPLTYELPKPMVPILGKPVMAYLIEHLVAYGVNKIMVNVSHLHGKIEEYFGDGHQFGAQIGYSFEGYVNDTGEVIPQPIGSAGGMKKIQDFGGFFDETTIVLCGDALTDLNLQSALVEHRKKGAMVSVITKEVPWDRVSNYGVVVSARDGRVLSFQEKPNRESALSNMASTGIYIFEPEVLDLVPIGQNFDIGSQLFPLLIKSGVPFFSQTGAFNWLDIGTISDYWSVLQDVMLGKVAGMEIPGTEIADGIRVGLNTRIDWQGTVIEGPVYIGSGCHIEANCKIIGPTWIGHGSHICSGSQIVRSVLFNYTRVLPDVQLYELVVFGNYNVDRNGNMRELSDEIESDWGNARDRRFGRRVENYSQYKVGAL